MPISDRIMHKHILSWESAFLLLTKIGIFLALLTPVIFTNQSFFPTLPPQTIYFRLLVEFSFGLYLLLLLQSRNYLPRTSPILIAILCFIGTLTVTSLLGMHPTKSFWGTLNRMEGIIAFLHYGLFFFVLIGVFRAVKEWVWVFRTVMVISIPVAIIGVTEFFGFTVLLPITDWERMSATMGSPAFYGAYLIFLIFLGIFLTLWENKVFWKIFAWSLVFINGNLLLMTGTRAAWIGVGFGALFFFMVWIIKFRKQSDIPRKPIFSGIIIILVIFFIFSILSYFQIIASNPVWERYQALSFETFYFDNQRTTFWPTAIKAWQESPLLGHGLESYPYAYEKFYESKFIETTPELEFYDRAHNIFLELLVTSGILGLLSYLALIGSAFWAFWSISRSTSSILPLVLIALLSAYLLHNFFSFDTTISYALLFIIFAFAHVWYCQLRPQTKWHPNFRIHPFLKLVALITVFMFICIIGYFANKDLWHAMTTLAQGYHLQYHDPIGTVQSFSKTCTRQAPTHLRVQACDLSVQLMLQTPFQFYGQTKQHLFTVLQQNLAFLHSISLEKPELFQIKHAILLAQAYETLYRETQDISYLKKEEDILLTAQLRNPNMLPIYRLAKKMYAATDENQKLKEFFLKAPSNWQEIFPE